MKIDLEIDNKYDKISKTSERGERHETSNDTN